MDVSVNMNEIDSLNIANSISIKLRHFRHKVEDCGLKIDIPLEYGPAEKYQGTLGHKVNHHFEPDTQYWPIETARYVY